MVPLGIPHSEFLRWTDEDRAKALAWQVDQAEHCPRCRQRRADWLGPDGKELKYPPFEIVDDYCPACNMLEEHQRDQRPEERLAGTRPAFREIDDWEPDEDEEPDG